MSDKELEALAKQLWNIHYEALGYLSNEMDFDHYSPQGREAWIQVAQFVEARWEESRKELLSNGSRFQIYQISSEPDHR